MAMAENHVDPVAIEDHAAEEAPGLTEATVAALPATGHPAPALTSPSPSIPHPPADLSPITQPIQVFLPSTASASNATTPSTEFDDAFFEPTVSDVQAHHASVIARSKRLNEAPLLTAKYRDQDRAERERRKADRWPTTTIRVKFSDGTQVQSTFPSTSPIQPVYAFVRSTLDPSALTKPFVLWQPPRTQYPEHPLPAPAKKPNPHRSTIIPPANYGAVRGGLAAGLQGGTGGKESLNEMGLVPQSVLLVKWEDEAMNASAFRAPLLAELLERSEPLPAAVPKDPEERKKEEAKAQAQSGGEKKIPKWLQKGLMKRK